MVDEIDRAQALAQRLLDQDLNRQLDREAENKRLKGTTHCCDCGIKIPAARRKAVPNACHCVDCQIDHERAEKEGKWKKL
ncbi:TraR/DksA family transcriptional regulator [Dongia sp.]|uniref:TraR/DksA family transcriptional regulator n=1 Tax=Dongia sp. TaxID=1977262 RepID=UPI0035B1E785